VALCVRTRQSLVPVKLSHKSLPNHVCLLMMYMGCSCICEGNQANLQSILSCKKCMGIMGAVDTTEFGPAPEQAYIVVYELVCNVCGCTGGLRCPEVFYMQTHPRVSS